MRDDTLPPGFEEVETAARAESADALNYPWPTLAEILAARERPPIIKGRLPSDSFVVQYGLPKSGKSFEALHTALCIASGTPWHGRDVAAAHVVYLCGEGVAGIRKRVQAWLQHHGVDPQALGDRFHLLPRPLELNAPGIVEKLIADIRAIIPDGERLALLIVDTLSRYMVGNQDTSEDMGAFVADADRLRAPFPGASVMAIHHAGKDPSRGLRGSSALLAAADFVVLANKPNGDAPSFSLDVEWSKDTARPEPVQLRLVPVTIGLDDDGEPVTSCIVALDDDAPQTSAKPKKQKPLTKAETVALEALSDLLARSGEVPPTDPNIPSGRRCVDEESWAQHAIARGVAVSDKLETQKRKFREARTGLRAAGRIGKWEQFVWLA